MTTKQQKKKLVREFFNQPGNIIGTPIGDFVLHNGEMLRFIPEVVEALHSVLLAHEAVVREECAKVCEELPKKLIDRDTNFGMNESYRLAIDEAAAATRRLNENV